MARDGLHSSGGPVGSALSALPPTLFGGVCVLVRESVPPVAMGSGLLFGTAGPAAQGEAAGIGPGFTSKDFRHREALRCAPDDRVGLSPARQSKGADKMAFPVDYNPLRVAPVALALRFGNPSAILGRVVPINVDAINHEAIRARPHISGEGVEIVDPSITNADAAPAIVLELFHSGVSASILHGRPHSVDGVAIFKRHSGSPCEKHTSMERQGEPE